MNVNVELTISKLPRLFTFNITTILTDSQHLLMNAAARLLSERSPPHTVNIFPRQWSLMPKITITTKNLIIKHENKL